MVAKKRHCLILVTPSILSFAFASCEWSFDPHRGAWKVVELHGEHCSIGVEVVSIKWQSSDSLSAFFYSLDDVSIPDQVTQLGVPPGQPEPVEVQSQVGRLRKLRGRLRNMADDLTS